MTNDLKSKIERTLADLNKRRAERKDALDLPPMTERERINYFDATTAIEQRIAAIRAAADAVASFGPIDVDLTPWLAFIKGALEKLVAQRAAIKTPIRDREQERLADRLDFSIKLAQEGASALLHPIVDLSHMPIGELMEKAGYARSGEALHGPRGWRGGIAEVEKEIKRLGAERDAAVAKLNSLLLSDAEQEQQEAERRAFADAMSTMSVRLTEDGAALAAFTTDGDPLLNADMTSAQRAAFERFAKAAGLPQAQAAPPPQEQAAAAPQEQMTN